MSPPRKDPTPNQDKNILGIQKDQFFPPHVPPFTYGFKSLGTRQVMIILKVQILHVLINIICNVLINIIL